LPIAEASRRASCGCGCLGQPAVKSRPAGSRPRRALLQLRSTIAPTFFMRAVAKTLVPVTLVLDVRVALGLDSRVLPKESEQLGHAQD
jgi:hypothetical protein